MKNNKLQEHKMMIFDGVIINKKGIQTAGVNITPKSDLITPKKTNKTPPPRMK